MGPGRITFGTTVPSSATVRTIWLDWSVTMALSGIRMASHGLEPGMRSRPNWPGVMKGRGWAGRRGADRAGAGLDPVVDEVHRPRIGQSFSSGSRAWTMVWSSRVEGSAPRSGALVGEKVALAHVEGEVDRVERDDGGQQGGVLGPPVDQVADATRRSDAAGERRLDLG